MNQVMKNKIAVFTCLTAYHVYVSYAYAKYLYKEYNIKSRLLIYGIPNVQKFTSDYIETIFLEKKESNLIELIQKRLVYAGYLFRFSKIGSIVNKNEKTILFVYNDLNPVCYRIMREVKKNDNDNPIIIVDEGLAIYTDTKENLKLGLEFYLREFVLRYIFGSPSHYKAIGDDERVDYVVVGDTELYASLRKAKGKRLLEQSKKPLFMPEYIKEYILNFFNLKPNIVNCSALIIGQNYSGNGLITEQEESLLLELGEIMKSLDSIIIKPHPTDNSDKYDIITKRYSNFRVLDSALSKIPMECLFGFYKSELVITFNSSSALNIANCFPDKYAVFLVDYALKDSGRKPVQERLSRSNPLHTLQFHSALEKANNVFTPTNADELLSIITITQRKEEKEITSIQTPQVFPEIDSIIKEAFENS